jgi:arylsulfatase A-like enzyme
MAAQGVLFERAYAPMSTTVPSHATLFTSLYPIQHGVTRNGQVLAEGFLTLAEVLRERGFQTGGFVATQSQFGPASLDQGFETFDQNHPDAETYRPANETVDAALAWLAAADPDRPLFLWVHLFDPHGPLIPPEAHRERFALRSNAERNALLALLVERHHARPHSFAHGMRRMLDEHVKYDAEIRFLDTELSRLHQGVERLGLGGRSLWIFVADHGEGMTRRSRIGHGRHIFQEQVHVPLIFHASDGWLEPRRVSNVVEHTDIVPTVAELVGATADLQAQAAPVQGHSLMPLLRGEPGDPQRRALVQRRSYLTPPPGSHPVEYELGDKFALVGEEWKYIHRTIGVDELYHLPSDPYEDQNLISRFATRAESMKRGLLERVEGLRHTAGGEAESVDRETLAELRAMGYVE